jgi:hypothetical protein
MATPGIVRVRQSLTTWRERGAPFDRAWTAAIRDARADAKTYTALKATKPAWRHAYEGAPATPGEVAVARLAELLERVA